MENKSEKKSRDALYITIIVLLLGVGIFLFFQMNQIKNNLATCSSNSEKLQADLNALDSIFKNSGMADEMGADLSENLNDLLYEYENLETTNKGMKDSIDRQIHRIDSLQKLAEKHKGDAYMIYKLRKETETLRSIMQGYVHTIDSLNRQNVQLRTDLSEKDKQLTNVSTERDELKENKKTLEEKVARGSVLQMAGLSSGAIHLRSSGTQVETTRAGRADKIKACATIMENAIAKSGRKDIYVVVTLPDATILGGDPNKTYTWEGGTTQYSLIREIDYQNAAMDLCVYVDVINELAKGVYIVEFYADRAKIGKTTFTLK
jgi:hypothetical protein